MIRRHRVRRSGILVAIGLLIMSAALIAIDAPPGSGPIQAATFVVNTTTDAVDVDPGDGVCSTESDSCSLRAAIQEANALEGADLITVPAGIYSLTIEGAGEDDGATGDLDILDDVVIEGLGATQTVLDAAGLDRYFDAPSVSVAVSITIRSLTIQNGAAKTVPDGGGAIQVQNGSLTLEDVGLFRNTTANGNGGAVNIPRGGSLVVSGSVIRLNEAHTGGGINSGVETTISQTTIADNSARLGGGVQVADAPLVADSVTISGNTAEDTGGGLQVFRSEMHISNSTISRNQAGGPSKGAGVHVSSGLSTLRHVTIVDNTNGFGLSGPFTDVLLENVIIANNPSGDCDERVRIEAVGRNLDSDRSCGFAITADPLLGPLSYEGGQTWVRVPMPGSPAVDAAIGCAGLATDQRGHAHPDGRACELGAVEVAAQALRIVEVSSGFQMVGYTCPELPIEVALGSLLPDLLRVFV